MIKNGGAVNKALKILGIVLGVIIGSLIIGYLFLLWAFAPGDTNELEAVANKFKPNPAWELKSKTVYPERKACLEANCDSLYYSWTTNEELLASKLNETLSESGFDFSVEGDCDPRRGLNGSGSTICEASGSSDGYSVRVSVTAAADLPSKKTIILNVSK